MKDKKEEPKNINDLMKEIKEVTQKQKAASRVDEIRVMKMMLNDPEYKVSVYDRNRGLIGTRCPREEAVKFVTSTTCAITGLETKSATELASNYEFSKKDAMFFLDNSRDFMETYLSTGRKYPIMQTVDSEAALFIKPVASRVKSNPSSVGASTTIPSFEKVVCRSKSPKYNKI